MSELLTGRALVGQLKALGVGDWTPDAVRQWIREEPPCPVAAPAQQGSPHRYALEPVLRWLKARAEKERGKGFTSQAGALPEKIERVLARGPGAGAMAEMAPAAKPAPAVELSLELPLASSTAVAPAKPERDFSEDEISELGDIDLLRQVLRGRDPRNWESAERALRLHRENRLAESRIIPVEDLENTLAVQAIAMRNACSALAPLLAQRIPDASSYAQRVHLIQQGMDEMLTRLSHEEHDAGTGAAS